MSEKTHSSKYHLYANDSKIYISSQDLSSRVIYSLADLTSPPGWLIGISNSMPPTRNSRFFSFPSVNLHFHHHNKWHSSRSSCWLRKVRLFLILFLNIFSNPASNPSASSMGLTLKICSVSALRHLYYKAHPSLPSSFLLIKPVPYLLSLTWPHSAVWHVSCSVQLQPRQLSCNSWTPEGYFCLRPCSYYSFGLLIYFPWSFVCLALTLNSKASSSSYPHPLIFPVYLQGICWHMTFSYAFIYYLSPLPPSPSLEWKPHEPSEGSFISCLVHSCILTSAT